jgi:hypothetical protein
MSTPAILLQGQLDPVIAPATIQFSEQEFHLANSTTDGSPAVTVGGSYYGSNPLIQEVLTLASEQVIAPVIAPVFLNFPTPPVAIVRTDPWTALTPAELELNREVAYTMYQPPIAVQ